MNQDKITAIFVEVDDFCQKYRDQINSARKLASTSTTKHRNRNSQLCDSEIVTIMIGFHLGAHKTFKHYYQKVVVSYY